MQVQNEEFSQRLKLHLETIALRIRQAEIKHGRTPGSVKLLAVSKGQPIQKIKVVVEAGQKSLGESYLQEALEKIKLLEDIDLDWHFIGNIQSNKTKQIAENFDWVHSLSRFKIAKRLHEQRPEHLKALNVCIEVNIDQGTTQGGVNLEELPALAFQVDMLKHLNFRGLMAIVRQGMSASEKLDVFQKIAQAQQKLVEAGLNLDTLSLGMSDDFEIAIAAGSTLVRIGHEIFGERIT